MERRKRRKNIIVKSFRIGIVLVVLGIMAYVGYEFYKETKIRVEDYGAEKSNFEVPQNNDAIKVEIEKQARKEGVNVAKEYRGYRVDAYLEIPALNLKTEVLKNYTKQGMEICVSKYWGPNPNEIGNYCIAGHNYITERMFSKLSKLKNGDEMILSDNENGKYTYEVYDIYKVTPENVKPLSQQTDGKREVTLITCSNYSKNRLVVKAVEQKI
ncbi:MAG: sortase [Clostridia bacterium]|nr:sortase [Clostridia bacterium]